MAGTDVRSRKDDHFAEEDWVDFARHQAEPEKHALLAGHLDDCPRCAQTLHVWRDVIRIAGDEASYRPPEEAVRQIKGQFALHCPPPLVERAVRAIALVFDSFRAPAPAAVRAAGAAPRHLLYRAGRYVIRLQLEQRNDPERVSIVGQLLDEGHPETALRDIAVLVSKGGRALDRTLTNYLGEFALEPNAAGTLRLSVGVPEIGTFTVQPPRWAEGDAGERASGESDRNK
jgi:hypothetical protein